MTDVMGQYAVGACLKFFHGCKAVAYSQKFYHDRPEEIDVVGINPSADTIYVCDVIIHFDGMRFGSTNESTLANIRNRLKRMKYYGETFYPEYNKEYMIWSPYVPKGAVIDGMYKLGEELGIKSELRFVINNTFTKELTRLFDTAKTSTSDYGEPFLRALQILYHTRPIKE